MSRITGTTDRIRCFKRPAALLFVLIAMMLLAGCGSGGTSSGEKEYIEEGDTAYALCYGDSYKNKWVDITAEVTFVDIDSDVIGFHALYSEGDLDLPFLVFTTKEQAGKIAAGMYVRVEGIIVGTLKSKKSSGGAGLAMIKSEAIEVSTYDELYAPALSTKQLGRSIEQCGISITLDRIEYAEEEARVYLSVKNDSGEAAAVYPFNATATQDGAEFAHENNYKAGLYGNMGEVAAGDTMEGVLRFRGLDPAKPVTVTLEALSYDWEAELEDYVFEVE